MTAELARQLAQATAREIAPRMARDVLWVFARTCAAEEPQGGRGGCDRGSFVMCGPRARLDRTAFVATSLFQLVVCGSTGGMNLRVRSSRVPCPCVCIVSERRDEVCGVRFIIARQAMVLVMKK